MGPVEVRVLSGTYSLRQMFTVAAEHSQALVPCKAASAEFAPEPGLDPLWISHSEPFHGAAKDDFGYHVVITVAPDND
jgi:hypothetical protein